MAKQDASIDPEVQKWLDECRDTSSAFDGRKLKDATTKFLALARHLLSFYPGTPAKGDAAAKNGKGKKK